MAEVDAALARLLRGLEARGMRASTDVIVLSDHGMQDVPRGQVSWLDARLPVDAYDLPWWPQVIGLVPKPGRMRDVEAAFVGRHDHYACWRKAEMPAQWHFRTHPRIPPIVCQADPGWRIQSHAQPAQEQALKGEHGFAPEAPRCARCSSPMGRTSSTACGCGNSTMSMCIRCSRGCCG